MSKAAYRHVSMSQIDEPPAPLRGSIDPEKLAELAGSLSTQGQLQPIILKATTGRYTIIAGHRRFLAAKSLGWETIEAKVFLQGVKDEQILSLIENLHREDLSPVEEARVVYDLVEAQELDVDLVATRFAKSRSWVDGRLDLCSYPTDILDALHAKSITLSVARELARVADDGYRQWLLHNAMENGATGRTARIWADEWHRSHTPEGDAPTAHPGPPPPYEGQPVGVGCAGCQTLYPIAQLRPLYCCPECIRDHFATIAAARKAAEEARP
ncbi:MAG: ParB/RepB/Spo0J family partition protein [Terriglobia bacterium]